MQIAAPSWPRISQDRARYVLSWSGHRHGSGQHALDQRVVLVDHHIKRIFSRQLPAARRHGRAEASVDEYPLDRGREGASVVRINEQRTRFPVDREDFTKYLEIIGDD